jgi:hypothetical protein
VGGTKRGFLFISSVVPLRLSNQDRRPTEAKVIIIVDVVYEAETFGLRTGEFIPCYTV